MDREDIKIIRNALEGITSSLEYIQRRIDDMYCNERTDFDAYILIVRNALTDLEDKYELWNKY